MQDTPKDKRINFSKSMDVCTEFFRDRLNDIELLKMISKFLSPIRSGRNFIRNKSVKNAIGFAYRIS